jgi:hypothetical protein
MTTKKLSPVAVVSVLCACGGGMSAQHPNTCIVVDPPATTEPNTIGLIVDPGPQCVGYTNGLFASVTLCVPGTTTCQTFDHLLVDTGSVGVRVLESELTLPLPAVTNASNLQLAECTPFVDGTAWGPLKFADVVVGGESASNLPIQLIGEKTFTLPRSCTGSAITDFETLAANGIFGVGLYLQDCGNACTRPPGSGSFESLYYACSSAQSCTRAAVPIAQQVAHPVAAFPIDNNGTIIQLPSIPASGAPSVPGVLTFGIGTQANNGPGSSTVLPTNALGYVGTTFPVGGATYMSYLDSGSNGLFFLDAQTANLKQCTGGLSSFYCPATTTSLSAVLSVLSVPNGPSATVAFSVTNAANLEASAYAFSNLAGPMPMFPSSDNSVPSFDWGLPFYFGRSVYTAIEGRGTPAGVGPYFAF